MDDWRPHIRTLRNGFGDVLEIAYDRTSANQAWREHVPEGLQQRHGDPREPGIYVPLTDVDFDSHAVVVWSGNQSGTCPKWVTDISSEGRSLRITTRDPEPNCMDEFQPYAMVLAVERTSLPKESRLPINNAMSTNVTSARDKRQSDSVVVDAYPATGKGLED